MNLDGRKQHQQQMKIQKSIYLQLDTITMTTMTTGNEMK